MLSGSHTQWVILIQRFYDRRSPSSASNGSNCGQVFSVSVLHWGLYLYTYFFLPICSIFSGQGKIAIESSYVYFFFICLATIKRIK